MPILQVISSSSRAGKSAVLAGLAQGLAGDGARVQVFRAGASEGARADAEAFLEAGLTSPGQPVEPSSIAPPAGTLALVELDAGEKPLDGLAVIVVRGEPTDADAALAKALGAHLIGSVATDVPLSNVDAAAAKLTDAGLRPLAILPEDRTLASPSVEDIRRALAADVLYEGENFHAAIENVLVAPVYTDGAKMHFWRYEGTRAVLMPSYKTDLALAAIEADAACVIVTGGHQPSHYVIDRVQHSPTTLLLAQQQTPAAVAALSDVWGTSGFSGEAKAAAAYELLRDRIDWPALQRKLA
ncbi:MAG TPA: DRTGG domain-containing protein [Dehalococcoidia bacterium]